MGLKGKYTANSVGSARRPIEDYRDIPSLGRRVMARGLSSQRANLANRSTEYDYTYGLSKPHLRPRPLGTPSP